MLRAPSCFGRLYFLFQLVWVAAERNPVLREVLAKAGIQDLRCLLAAKLGSMPSLRWAIPL